MDASRIPRASTASVPTKFCMMIHLHLLAIRTVSTSFRRSLPSSTMSALSVATAVPVPIATPTFASTSAGASLTPSPTMATERPSRFSSLIRHGRRRQDLQLAVRASWPHLDHPRFPEGHRPRLVEDHGVDGTEGLEEEAALHDGPDPRCATDGAQDGEGRAGRNPAGPRHDDHGDGRASIPREREGEGCTGQGEVDEVSREPVGQLLDGRPRALCSLDCIDDLAEGRAAIDAGRRDLEHPRAVDGAGKGGCARGLCHRHRLTSDRGLVNGGTAP